VLSLNDKSFFNVVDLPFHPSDIAAQIMLCLVSEFIPLSEHSVKICALSQVPNDAIATLVDDSIWSIFSQAVSDRQTEVQRDALTFICSRGCSFDDFCSMFDDVFVLYEVVKGQGELHPLLHVLHSLFLISKGILRLARTSVERVTEVTFFCSGYARWTVWPMSSVACLCLSKYVNGLSNIYPQLCRPPEVALVRHAHMVYVRIEYGK